MMKTAFLGGLAVIFLAGAVGAQENAPAADDPRYDQYDEMMLDDPAIDPRPQIRVLGNPYDLASFYRSSQGGFYDYRPEGSAYPERYPIASYYRQRSTGGYAPFWTNGYAGAGYGQGRQNLGVGYRRRIGENGDLFLFAPTFLSPIGPLTGAFFGR